MKKKTINNKIIKKLVAGTLAIFLSLTLTSGLSVFDNEGGMDPDPGLYDVIITEEHELPIAYADGKYNGEGSNSAIGGEGTYETKGGKKRSFNILEIVPDKRMALIGYSIAGCEPVSQADLDAMVNKEPGSSEYPNVSAPEFNGRKIGDIAMNNSKTSAMYYYADHMNGYYEYVGEEEGVYSFVKVLDKQEIYQDDDEEGDQDYYVKDVQMLSKYYDNSKTGYNYIWVEDDSLESFDKESIDHKTKLSEVSSGENTGEKIYVYNHYKNKYVNNELFLCLMSNLIDGIDHSMGIYTGGNRNDPFHPSPKVGESANFGKVEEWRKTNTVTVVTKDPQTITVKDVDNADFIIINNTTTDGSYQYAYDMMVYASDDDSPLKDTFGGANDISVDVMKRIYKHVVIDEDVAIAVSQHVANSPSDTKINTARLGCMLFFIQKKDVELKNGDTVCGTGRDFFKNLLFDYGKIDPNSNEKYINNNVDIVGGHPVTDYLYIDDNGKLISTGDARITMDDNHWELNNYNFPFDWLWHEDLALRYHYGYKDYWRNNKHYQLNCNGEGYYELSNSGTLTGRFFGKFRNQIFYNETYSLFSDQNDGASALLSINSYVRDKILLKEHLVDSDETVMKNYFLSMNIVNGDSMTPELRTGSFDVNRNKTLYINKYELSKLVTIPINIEIVTSDPITSITVTKTNRDGTKIKDIDVYSSETGILKDGGSLKDASHATLTINDDKTKYVDGKPEDCKKVNNIVDYYKYTLSGSIELNKEEFIRGANNTIKVEVTNELGMSERDLITIVTRDFFNLN